MLGAPNIEFLQLCSLVAKGERGDPDLAEAIRAARADLVKLQEEFILQTDPSPGTPPQAQKEIDEVVAAIRSYTQTVDFIETYLSSQNKVILSKGMEQVKHAVARIEAGVHRYQVALLAVHGPTDMPGYNFVANAVKEYADQRMSRSDLETILRAAHDSVQKSLEPLNAHIHVKEVEQLKKAYENHQESLKFLNTQVALDKPLEEALHKFQKSCEFIRETLLPAQLKILTENPTPSKAANFMINVTKEIASGNIHPTYFKEAFKHLKMEFELFNRQLQEWEIKPPDSEARKKLIEKGRAGLEIYSSALQRFRKFEETMETKHLSQGSLQLQEAVLQLYNVFKSLRSL